MSGSEKLHSKEKKSLTTASLSNIPEKLKIFCVIYIYILAATKKF